MSLLLSEVAHLKAKINDQECSALFSLALGQLYLTPQADGVCSSWTKSGIKAPGPSTLNVSKYEALRDLGSPTSVSFMGHSIRGRAKPAPSGTFLIQVPLAHFLQNQIRRPGDDTDSLAYGRGSAVEGTLESL